MLSPCTSSKKSAAGLNRLLGMSKCFSTCSCARIGSPAATRPIKGRPVWWSAIRMPRLAPGIISMAPFLARAFKCSSAAFGLLKPNSLAISARVGGNPESSIADLIRSKTCCWRAVSLIIMSYLFLYTYCDYIQCCMSVK